MCKYCKPFKEESIIWNTHTLYKYNQDEDCLIIKLDTLQNKNEKKANLIVEAWLCDKVGRGTLSINFCPMCGRNLLEKENK